MKTKISKSVLAIVAAGIALSVALVWFGLHPRERNLEPSATPAVAEPLAGKSVASTAPTPVNQPATTVVAANRGSLPVIPISLTNVIDQAETDFLFNEDAGLKALPTGTQVYGGIEFWLQGAVSRDDEHANFRASINVPLDETNFTDGKWIVTQRGQNIACIYLIAATRFGAQVGEKFADVIWHYADGTSARSEIKYNVQLRDWWRAPYEDPAQLPNVLTKVAWHGLDPTRKNGSIRLYRVAFLNPHLEKTIRSLEFASALARPSLFIAALTLDPLLPGARPDNLTSDEMADPALNGQLQLLVQDADGHPLPGAEVSASSKSAPAGSITQKFTTDAGGLALVRYLDTALETLDVSATHDGYSGRKMLWDLKSGDTVPVSYTLKLASEIKIGGIVVDEQGSPIPDVNIRAYRFWTGTDGSPQRKGEQPSFSSASTTTDANGHWEVKGLPFGLLDHIGVEASHPDYIGERIQNVNGGGGDQAGQLRAETYKMTLKQGLVVNGRVLDDSDNPVVGATVFGGQRYYSERQQMTTDDQGRFHFGRMKEGQMEFSVIAKGRSPAIKNVNEKPGMDEIVFRLGPGKVIQGIVQNAAGEPLAGTRIELEDANGGVAQSYEFSMTSGSDGRFEWNGAPDEPVHFYFYHSGYEQKRGVLLKTDSDNTVILQKNRTIQGQVVDADTGNPITKFRIGIGRDPGKFGGSFYPDYPGMKDYTDPNGAFTLQSDEENDAYIDASADDYAETGQTLPAAQNDTVQVMLKLKQSPALHGVVVSSFGQPLPGISVALLNSNLRGGGGLSLSGTKLRSYNQSSKVSVTDDQGQFVLGSPPESGGMVMAVGEAGFACVPVDQVRSSSTVVLQPFGRIVGTMKSGGQPAVSKGLIVTFNMPGVGSDWDAYKRTTDDQGNFTFENVPPGDVKIQRLIPNGENSWSYSDATDVTVKPGETTQVSLGDNGAVLVGRIRFDNPLTNAGALSFAGNLSGQMPSQPSFNSPAEAQAFYNSPEWKALMKLHKNYAVEMRPDGTFTVDDVAPGVYSMNISTRLSGQRPWEHPPVANGTIAITVPNSADPLSPIDIGEIVLKAVPQPTSPATIWR